MKKLLCISVLAAGTLFSSTLLAADSSASLTANIVYKIGTKTYNGTTSGVLNVSPEPTPGPAPTPEPTYITSMTFDNTTIATSDNSSGTDGVTGIRWTTADNTNNVTIYCPSGFGMPINAVAPNYPDGYLDLTNNEATGSDAKSLYIQTNRVSGDNGESNNEWWSYNNTNGIEKTVELI